MFDLAYIIDLGLRGALHASPLFIAVYFGITAFITMLSVTCYLHRSQTHRSVFFIAPINHFFRFWLWLMSGTVTKEWVAVHRKHHAKCDTAEDPHSPRYFGLKKILLEGADIYQNVAKNNPALLAEYGDGTPDDWLERHIYTKRSGLGIYVALVVEVFLFGVPGIVMWCLQMLIIPVLAAGFINGIAHRFGYKRYKDGDIRDDGKPFQNIGDSLNVPTYILGLGEEFHNNHHAYQNRYKFSHAWWEVDIAGTMIELLTWIGFAWVPRTHTKK